MTAPGISPPSVAFIIGGRYGQDITESSARAVMSGSTVRSFENAQDGFKNSFAGAGKVAGEVGRINNRIDELVFGEGKAQLATFSTSGVWMKPPNCRKIVVDILGGASGAGCGNSSNSSSVENWGLGGFSGAWSTFEINPVDLPDTVSVTVGSGGVGSSTRGAYGAGGNPSSFHGRTAEGAGPNSYGDGTQSFRIRGGRGGYSAVGKGENTTVSEPGSMGGAGSYSEGGRGSATFGVPGESGFGISPGKVGMGSAGGGGFRSRINTLNFNDGSAGGGGGWPAAPGGGGGAGQSNVFGRDAVPGVGGSGATGAVFVTAYLETATP